MKKLIMILFSINLLSAPSQTVQEKALDIISKKNIILETRSLVSWQRFFSSEEKIEKTSYKLNDEEIRIMKLFIKLKIQERNKKFSVGI